MSLDKIYFACKKAFLESKSGKDLKERLSKIDFSEINTIEAKLRSQDVTDRAINHAKEQEWREIK